VILFIRVIRGSPYVFVDLTANYLCLYRFNRGLSPSCFPPFLIQSLLLRIRVICAIRGQSLRDSEGGPDLFTGGLEAYSPEA